MTAGEVLISTEGDLLRVISPEGLYMYEMDSGYADFDEVFAGYRAGMLPCRRCGRIRVPRPHDYLSGLSNCICADCSKEVLSWYRAEVTPPTGWAEVPREVPKAYGWREFGRDALLVGGFVLVAILLVIGMVNAWDWEMR